ncbi:hypothetical protein V8G54_004511 [Vigna mungo]|uniref:Uncharacterized protein n=1 Tax=Vigna mungo TaxID=3915 RepID=A0AAQ3SCZ1_VIGMU
MPPALHSSSPTSNPSLKPLSPGSHHVPFFIAFSETLCTEKQLQLSKTSSSSSPPGSRQSHPSIVAIGSFRRRTHRGSQQKRHPQERGFECGRCGQWRYKTFVM